MVSVYVHASVALESNAYSLKRNLVPKVNLWFLIAVGIVMIYTFGELSKSENPNTDAFNNKFSIFYFNFCSYVI